MFTVHFKILERISLKNVKRHVVLYSSKQKDKLTHKP